MAKAAFMSKTVARCINATGQLMVHQMGKGSFLLEETRIKAYIQDV